MNGFSSEEVIAKVLFYIINMLSVSRRKDVVKFKELSLLIKQFYEPFMKIRLHNPLYIRRYQNKL